MGPKRKRSSVAATSTEQLRDLPLISHERPILPTAKQDLPIPASKPPPPKPARQKSCRGKVDTNPDHNNDIFDGQAALRASPDADEEGEAFDLVKADASSGNSTKVNGAKRSVKEEDDDSPLSDLDTPTTPAAKKVKKTPTKSSIAAKKGSDEIKIFKAEQAAKKAAEAKVKKENDDDGTARADPDGDEDGPAEDMDAVKREAGRPPPVNSDYLPLPWKGRLGYACLNTYLRMSNPPVFTSRTCRIASILEHRHPLKDPSQPEHATKNRPDKAQPADVGRGQRYVEELGLANARDIPKMLRWNEKYGIRFLRLSSEMFPFASHEVYGYKLAPFASEALAEVGKVAAELGHRLSTHPGQFTQLGSPRAEVIKNAIRDLDYHDELLSLLKLPPQEDRDAVMILHLGGTFGDKVATLDRFRENYKTLSQSVKNRLVLENDDVSWSVHDLLPLCEELNIPLVLDFHHHNIIFDSTQLREGTKDIMEIFPRIKATWDRKKIKQKMHYSEPTPSAVTGRQRRKHNPRPATLPPCPNDMDLMIEAKDKEQAVFELMRTLKLPGWNTFNDIIPYERADDNKPLPTKVKKKKTKKQIAAEIEEYGEELQEEEDAPKAEVPESEIGMGGPENRVYWPPGMEEWLRPKKREVKKKIAEDDLSIPTPHNFAARREAALKANAPLSDEMREKLATANSLTQVQTILEEIKSATAPEATTVKSDADDIAMPVKTKGKTAAVGKSVTGVRKAAPAKQRKAKTVPTPSMSDDKDEEEDELSMEDSTSEDEAHGTPLKLSGLVPVRQSRRASTKMTSYIDDGSDVED